MFGQQVPSLLSCINLKYLYLLFFHWQSKPREPYIFVVICRESCITGCNFDETTFNSFPCDQWTYGYIMKYLYIFVKQKFLFPNVCCQSRSREKGFVTPQLGSFNFTRMIYICFKTSDYQHSILCQILKRQKWRMLAVRGIYALLLASYYTNNSSYMMLLWIINTIIHIKQTDLRNPYFHLSLCNQWTFWGSII